MSNLSITTECMCGKHIICRGNIIKDCPKCGRDGSKQEIISVTDHDEKFLDALVWMVDEGGLDPLHSMKI